MAFDQLIERKPTYSFKWQKYEGKDILPVWVADTEFKCAQPILDALRERVDHGILGYTLPAHYEPGQKAVQRWLKKQYQWDIELDWIVWTPGVVPAFNVVCKAFCKPGEKVMVQTPNYPPLLAAPKLNGLKRIDIGTNEVDGRWELDFDELEKQAADPECKLFIICNPMNPVGTVLTEQELQRVTEICLSNGVLLCSDEIHCDLILEDKVKHIPAGSIEQLKNNSVTLMAASKTFNVAGLGASFAIIPDAVVRRQFNAAAAGIVPWVNLLGLTATEAAFTECDDWHQALLQYLRLNRDYLYEEINAIPGLRMLKCDATFLAWIDASGLDTTDPQKYFEEKGVGPSPGVDFGDNKFVRINFGCPKEYLEQVVARLKA